MLGYPGCVGWPRLREEDAIAKRVLDKYKGRLTPEEIAEGMNAAVRNAVRLAEDAELLLESGRFPSAAALAILAIEESGKLSILRRLSVAQGDDKALDTAWRGYRSHTQKNVSWLLPQLFAKGARSLDDLILLFRKDADHPFILDNLKQISLYTDCLGDSHWSVPAEVIDEEIARVLVQIARVMSKHPDATAKEIELWVKHMKPYIGPGAAADYGGAKRALRAWYADMKQHGLTTHGDEKVEAFLYGSID